MYWYRRIDARNKAAISHPQHNPNGRTGLANALNYFLTYRCVYNRPHDHRGNRHARAGNDQDGDQPRGPGRRPARRLNPEAGEFRPELAAHQAAFYEMWTGVQPVVTAKGLLQFPGIDEADGEVQRMLRNNPVWRGNITHGALIPAVAARINALDARARGLHDARREQHRKAETTTAQIKGQPRRR